MNNILITGANGQLGSEIRERSKQYPSYNFIFADSVTLDITNSKKIHQFIVKKDISVIINCAAYTAVDKAETEFEKSNKTNNLAVENLAQIAKDNRIKLIHISTDYVFDGNNFNPFIETDTPNPKSVYGKTKLAGELVMQEINPQNSIIIRTSWIYSSFGNNFVKTMLRLAFEKEVLDIISDQVGTPTYAGDLAEIILEILPQLNNKNVEVFHYSNEGVCSWYDFAKAIFDIKKIEIKVNAIESSQYPTSAKRPFYSVLNKAKIKSVYKIEIPYWRDSLKNFLHKR